ncbi:MAG: T9SS type A sorting domain-containing protein, partial [Elusimicrobiota bacterium]
VKAKTTHFSLYQVFSGTVSAAAFVPLAADATFTFRDAYAFPNPVRGVGTATIRIQTGQADSVEVRVYDVSGRKIHSSSNFSLNTNFDDGNGKGPQYTYDHVWDISGVGSGVYQYVITAKKAGQSDIHKTGRVGVVK